LFRQICLNLLHASVRGNFRSDVKIKASSKTTEGGSNVIVEIVNSRNDLSKQDCAEIEDLCLEEELSRILEVDSIDTNLKIALILARQLGWPIDFVTEGKESRFVMVVPSTNWGNLEDEQNGRPAIPAPPARDTSAYDGYQGRNDGDFIAETNPLASHDSLARPANKDGHADCLLVSCSDLVPLFERGLGFKCDESFLEESAINSITRSFKKRPYKFIFVDLDDPTLLLGRFMVSLRKIL